MLALATELVLLRLTLSDIVAEVELAPTVELATELDAETESEELDARMLLETTTELDEDCAELDATVLALEDRLLVEDATVLLEEEDEGQKPGLSLRG